MMFARNSDFIKKKLTFEIQLKKIIIDDNLRISPLNYF